MTKLIGHTGVWSGKRVKAHLVDGSKFIAKFKERKSNRIFFFDHEPITTTQLKTLTIWKGKELHE